MHTQTHRCSTIVRAIRTISVPPQSPITIGCLAITAPALQQAKRWMGGDVIRMLSCGRLMAGSLQSAGHGLQGLRKKVGLTKEKTYRCGSARTLWEQRFCLYCWMQTQFYFTSGSACTKDWKHPQHTGNSWNVCTWWPERSNEPKSEMYWGGTESFMN